MSISAKEMEMKLLEIKELIGIKKKIENEIRKAIFIEKNQEKADEMQRKIWEIEGTIEGKIDYCLKIEEK